MKIHFTSVRVICSHARSFYIIYVFYTRIYIFDIGKFGLTKHGVSALREIIRITPRFLFLVYTPRIVRAIFRSSVRLFCARADIIFERGEGTERRGIRAHRSG